MNSGRLKVVSELFFRCSFLTTSLVRLTGTRLLRRGQPTLQLAFDFFGVLGLRLERQGLLPLKAGFPLAANAPEGIAQMVVKNRDLPGELDGPLEMLDGLLEVAKPVMGPAQAVDDIAVVTLLAHGLLDQRHTLLEIAALIDPGVAEVVQHQRLFRASCIALRRSVSAGRPFLQPLVAGAARVKIGPMLLLGLADQRDGPRVVVDGFRIPLVAAHDGAERIERANVVGILACRPRRAASCASSMRSSWLRFRALRISMLDLERRILGYAVVGGDGRCHSAWWSRRRWRAWPERTGKSGRQVEGELQIDGADADAALPGQRLAQPVERLGQDPGWAW